MAYINNISLIKSNNLYEIIIELKPEFYEFADEFNNNKLNDSNLNYFIDKIKKLYPFIKITSIKIMIGSMLVSTIPLNINANITDSVPLEYGIEQENQSINRFNMSYIYFGSLNSQLQYVTRAENSLNVVSPNYFDINENGNLKTTTLLNTSFIQSMKEKNIKIVPFLSNHFNRSAGIKALENYQQLAKQISNYVESYNLDGINIDIENLTKNERTVFTNFIKELRNLIPTNKEVSIAVAANPNNISLDKWWYGFFDYNELAKYADYLMIMAYDEHYYGSLEGPVASYTFVENSIKYALQHAPKEKIVLGIPFYGRLWLEDGSGGYGINLAKIEEMLSKYTHQISYNNTSKSPLATITIKASDPPFKVNYKLELKEGTYNIWFENNESIKSKLSLVQKYDLKGTGSWSLGQETSDMWNYYNIWLNSCYFEDIENSWAKDEILQMVNKKWMLGISNTLFKPKSYLTRAQAATLLTRALDLPIVSSSTNKFKDIENHWAKSYINTIAYYGFMIGFENNFEPDRPLSREEMATLLYRILNISYNKTYTNSFTDISVNKWSYNAIQALAKSGILKGYGDQTFRPTQPIKREEMASLLVRITDEIEQSFTNDK